MIPAKLIRYAALGALGVAPGVAACYALLLFAFRPTPTAGMPGSGGGIDTVSWLALAVAMLVPFALIAAWHVDFSRQLKASKNSCPGV